MAQNHPFMQQLQQMLTGTMAMPGAPQAGGQPAAAGAADPGSKFRPLTGDVTTMGTHDPAAPMPVAGMDHPKIPGGSAGTSPVEMSGVPNMQPATQQSLGPAGVTSPGNFNYMDVLRNSGNALMRFRDPKGGGLY